MKKFLSLLMTVIMLFSFVSCASSKRMIKNPKGLSENETIIVGKIELDPPMKEDSQKLEWPYDADRYKFFLMWSKELRKPVERAMHPMSPDLGASIKAFQGETFYAAGNSESFYIIASAVRTKGISNYFESAVLPASFRVEIQPGDRAVYIGTIRYNRDNFFQIKSIKIIDEYEKELAEFKKIFGDIPLKKALIRQPPAGFEYKVGEPY